MQSKAQRRSRRWAFCLCLGFLGFNAYTEESGCERLPAYRQEACREIVRCLAIDDAEKSQACLRAASEIPVVETQKRLRPPPRIEPTPSYEEVAVPTKPSRPPEASKAAPTKKRLRLDIFRRNSDRKEEPRRRRIFKRDDKPEETVKTTTVERSVLTIPKRYTGEITALKILVRDRQLVALDNQLLFEAERALGGKLKVGDQVRVTRISSFLGNRFQLIGPNRRPISASRIQCERVKEDLNPQSRSRCLMLGNSSTLENN